MRVSVDWLRFSLDPHYKLTYAMTLMHSSIDEYIVGGGMMGYKTSYTHKLTGHRIFADGNDNMGLCIDISGGSLPLTIRCATGSDDVASFLDLLLGIAKLSRIDLACDDLHTMLTIGEIREELIQGHYVTRAKEWTEYTRHETDEIQTLKGSTIYIGSRTSETMLRIYDKSLEQGFTPSVHGNGWIRYEIEIKGKRAEQIAQVIRENHDIASTALSLLNKHFSLRIPSSDSHKDRWSLNPTWSLLTTPAKWIYVPSRVCHTDKDLSRKYDWLLGTVSKTFALVNDSDIDDNLTGSLLALGRNKAGQFLTAPQRPLYPTL